MNRLILGFGAFILTFGFSFSLVGLLFGFPKPDSAHFHNSSSERAKIMRVLDRDIYYGEKRRDDGLRLFSEHGSEGISKSETLKSPEFADITERYVSSSSAIDVSGTPADFAYAWNEHMDAWNAQVRYLKSRGDSENGLKNLSDNSEEISSTYFQVLRIAKRYGAPMRSRYFR